MVAKILFLQGLVLIDFEGKTVVFWKVLSFVFLAGLLVYMGYFCYKVQKNLSYKHKVLAKIDKLSVAELAPDRYAIEAKFHYVFDGVERQSKYIFIKPYFINQFAAEKQIRYWNVSEMECWVNASKPNQGVLQKNFPFKELVYLVVLVFVNIYLAYLRLFLKRHQVFSTEKGSS